MKIYFSKLRHLPVVTASGTSVGKVSDVILTTDGHTIDTYVVKKGLLTELLISPAAVIAITDKQMVVKDTMIEVPEIEAVPSV